MHTWPADEQNPPPTKTAQPLRSKSVLLPAALAARGALLRTMPAYPPSMVTAEGGEASTGWRWKQKWLLYQKLLY
jgi:hypothetical protein